MKQILQMQMKQIWDPESDSESEPEADQKHVVKKVNIKHQLELFPDVTDVANTGGIGSRKVNPQDDVSPTKLTRDEKKNAEKSDVVPSNITCDDSLKVKLGNKDPIGTILPESRIKKSIRTVKKSSFGEHASPETKSNPYEPYENNQVKFLSKKEKKNNVHDDDEIRIAGLPERKPERAKV